MIEGLGRVRMVDSTEEAAEMMRWLGERRDVLAVDVETSGLSPEHDEIRLFQIGDTREGWAVPWRDWRGAGVEVMRRWDGPMAMHNARFDTAMLEADGVEVDRTRVHDTMVQSHLIDPRTSNGLKNSASREFGRDAAKGERILKTVMKRGKWGWDTIPVEHPAYWGYGVLDTVLTARLHEQWHPQVQERYASAYDVEVAVGWVLLDQERRGVRVDPCYLKDQRLRLETEEEELRARAKAEFGLRNPTSNREVGKMLRHLGVPLTEKTADGQWAVGKDILEPLGHPLTDLVLKVRDVRRNRVNYVGALLDARDEQDIVRPNIWPFGARTGRMSISNPPLQQIPRGSFVRRGFIPRDGHRLVGADFDQIELRLFAHYAQEQGMIEAIRAERDLHSYVAALVYGLDTDDLDAVKRDHPDLRQITKAVNFARIYGAGAEKIAWTAGVPKSEIDDFLDRYDQQFPRASKFMADTVAEGKRRERSDGYPWINTWLGQRLPADPGKAYTLTNYLIQGTAAEVFKVALLEMSNVGLDQYMVLPVHDEILLDVPTEDADEVARLVTKTMTNTTSFSVPLTAEAKAGDTWAEIK